MKIFALIALWSLFIGISASAQYAENPNGLTVKKTFLDYYSTNDGGFPNIDRLSGGWEIGFIHNLSKHMNVTVPVRFGIVKKPEEITNTVLFGMDALLQYQHFDRQRLLNPYALAGIGYTSDGIGFKNTVSHAPVGVGMNINLFNGAYANAQVDYRIGLSEASASYLQYSVGVMFLLKKEKYKKKKEVREERVLAERNNDRDGDGVPNEEDACPRQKGKPELGGCPDMDNDGIADMDDLCPDLPGSTAHRGCPDTDGDQVPDNVDECPEMPGLASNRGCPAQTVETPDPTEVPTVEPPTEPAPIEKPSSDEPVVEEPVALLQDSILEPDATQRDSSVSDADYAFSQLSDRMVFFTNGGYALTEKAKNVLDELATFLREFPDELVALEGHSDSSGDSIDNLFLSEARARACYTYLLNRGIPAQQLEYRGYGEQRPLIRSSNRQEQSANRRVEIVRLND